jgi:DNA integrity scanning protein DisA with diadenylate cyclase activity
MDAAATVERVCGTVPWCDPQVLDAVVRLALEIAWDGREKTRTGALFTLGRADAVVARSRPLILDPLFGHSPAATHINDARLRGTIKELAGLDGAFVVAEDGTVVAGCRYLDVPAHGIDVPLGLGSRHLAAAAITKHVDALAIAVSETGVVRLFYEGHLVGELRQTLAR